MKKSVILKPKQLRVASMKKSANYEEDFYKWTRLQSDFLKKEEFDKLDIRHLIEEIESLGNSEKRAL